MVTAASFKLRDPRFEGFEDIGQTALSHKINVRRDGELSEYEDEYNVLDIWAHMSLAYEGEPPESYRVLNSMILDWVEENENKIKEEINPKLKPFLEENLPNLDISDLEEDFDDYIWEEQVDYMPGIDDEDGRLHFFIELVLEIDDEPEEGE